MSLTASQKTLLNQSFEEGAIAQPITEFSGKPKPKRNDPCPCGSGLKYKNCCGKSGPKKGLLV